MKDASLSSIKLVSCVCLCFFILFTVNACTPLGDLLTISLHLKGSKITLADIDQSILPEESLGSSPVCITRHPRSGGWQYIGICIDEAANDLVVYKTFAASFELKEKGVTKKLVESQDFSELEEAVSLLEQQLNGKKISFSKGKPTFQKFNEMQKRFQLTR